VLLRAPDAQFERANDLKLLGVCVSSDLRWNHYANYVYKRANYGLHFCDSWKGQQSRAKSCYCFVW